MNSLQEFLNQWWLVGLWAMITLACVAVLLRDLKYENPEIGGLMKLVWVFTVAYSGPLGLWLYWKTGRKQISNDSIWRRGARSVAHCYSGCGLGEITGVFITVGLLSLNNWWVAGVTFVLAYVAGFALTVGPLMQEGVGFKQAMLDAVYSETPSITVMEIVAISVDLILAGSATMGQPIFWASLIVSLTLGLLAAYPVNVLLIRMGVKEGMHDPREMAAHQHH
ncbi:MAG: DUF4396 domain-containing protein [Tepidamorphaceae bacterium]|nr:DUF4396 domain-containing protein [Rhodobiaceae bacterium]MCC0049622.1 DUF4396 domain-containing protein [Rhodobiaceae bacterium]